jgi:hypothetical protein
MNPISINNKWYIEIQSDEKGYVLMKNPNNESEPISFSNNQATIDYIESVNY